MPRTPADVTRGRELIADDFRGQARDVASDLVGTLLLNHADDGPVGGLVVETEAYVDAIDPACHLSAGRTSRTASFFSGPGTVYVYSIHGHAALNLITTYKSHPEGILLRAIEPTHGLDAMRERRGVDDPSLLAAGPGRLTEALGVTREYDDRSLADTALAVYETDWNPTVETTARIGVTAAEDWPLRFVAAGNDYVSEPPPDVALDHDAVEAAYDALQADDLPSIDTGAE